MRKIAVACALGAVLKSEKGCSINQVIWLLLGRASAMMSTFMENTIVLHALTVHSTSYTFIMRHSVRLRNAYLGAKHGV